MTRSRTLGWSHCKSSPRCVFLVTSWRWLEDGAAPLLPAKPSSPPHGGDARRQRPTVNFASCCHAFVDFFFRLTCFARYGFLRWVLIIQLSINCWLEILIDWSWLARSSLHHCSGRNKQFSCRFCNSFVHYDFLAAMFKIGMLTVNRL